MSVTSHSLRLITIPTQSVDSQICLIMQNPRITQEEIGIIKRAQAGDITAFNHIFKKYKGFVDHVLYQYIKDKDEAKDITNIVFLKVYEKLSSFKTYDSFGGWLRIIANRTAIDYLRSLKDKEVELGTIDVRPTLDTLFYNKDDDVVDHMTYKELIQEFKKLPETTRRIFELFYVENLTVEAISEQLSIPTGTIKSTLSRTRKRIRKTFKNV